MCFFLLSRCRSLLGCCGPSQVSYFNVIDGGMKNLKESIRRCVFVFDFPATVELPANDLFLLLDGLSTALRFFIATRWVGSNTATGLLSKSSYMDDMMDIFLAKNNRACDVASSAGQSLAQRRHSRLLRFTPFYSAPN